MIIFKSALSKTFMLSRGVPITSEKTVQGQTVIDIIFVVATIIVVVDVTQLKERTLPTSEDPGSNPAFIIFYKELLFTVNCWKYAKKDKEGSGMAIFTINVDPHPMMTSLIKTRGFHSGSVIWYTDWLTFLPGTMNPLDLSKWFKFVRYKVVPNVCSSNRRFFTPLLLCILKKKPPFQFNFYPSFSCSRCYKTTSLSYPALPGMIQNRY